MERTLHYDPELKHRVNGNNGDSVVMNSQFARWSAPISKDLDVRCGCDGYEDLPELFTACIEHEEKNARRFNSSQKDVLVLVHPFYLSLIDMANLGSDLIKRQAREYSEKLLGLLKRVPRSKNLGITVFETAQLYAACTSLLLEQGLIDNVIFTHYDSGKPLCADSAKFLRDRRLFLGGGYNMRCLAIATYHLTSKHGFSSNNLWAVEDLVLNCSRDNPSSLIAERDRISDIRESQVISLERFTKEVYDVENLAEARVA